MKKTTIEEDEEGISSPVLSTTILSPILSTTILSPVLSTTILSPVLSTDKNLSKVSAVTKKFDFKPSKSPPNLSVLDRKNAEKSKDEVNFSSNLSNMSLCAKSSNIKRPKSSSVEKLPTSSVSKRKIQDVETPPKNQSKTNKLYQASSEFKEPCLNINRNKSKTKKIRLFAHEPFDDYENISENPSISIGTKPVELESDKPKVFEDSDSAEFGSPELTSRKIICSNSVSPEIKTKKALLKHQQKIRHSGSSKNSFCVPNLSKSRINKEDIITEKSQSNNVEQLNPSSFQRTIFSTNTDLTMKNVQAISNVKHDEIPSDREVKSIPLNNPGKLESGSPGSKSKNVACKKKSLLDSPTSPILEIKSSGAKKKKKRFKPSIGEDANSFLSVESHHEKEILTNEADVTYFNEECTSPLVSSNRVQKPNRSEVKMHSSVLSPAKRHEKIANDTSTPHGCSSNQFSPFNYEHSDYSPAIMSSTGANIKNICKRLSFHSSTSEKRRSKGAKPSLRLDLKKKNNLDDQFSRLSKFCKVNTSLSTKSPSNLTIRKSKLKRFDANKEDELTSTSNLSSSVNFYNFDKSPSPVLESSMNSVSRLNSVKDNSEAPEKFDFSSKAQVDESHLSESERIDDDPLSPCFKTPKKVVNRVTSSNMSSDLSGNKLNPSTKFKFSFNDNAKSVDNKRICITSSHMSSNLSGTKLKPPIKFKFSFNDNAKSKDDKRLCCNSNEPASPILEFRKFKILKSDHVTESNCDINADGSSQISQAQDLINVTDVDIEENMTDDQKILNETIFEERPSKENLQINADIVEDDVTSSQAENIVARTQGSMTIEVSESSGTQQSQISDGNLPCDKAQNEESAGHQPSNTRINLPPPNDEVFESAKKKKRRYKNGTLSARLNRLLKRSRSEMRMWAHEMQNEASDPVAINFIVDVVSYEMNKWLLKCRVISDSGEGSSSNPYFVILHPSPINNALVTPGTVLKVFPKWQTLDLLSPKMTVVYNISRVKLIPNPSPSSLYRPECKSKQIIQVVDPLCSCSRDLVLTNCVHKILSRQTFLGPLIPVTNSE
nr:PREDICTED: uncharacterized protein LOC109031437 isoform X1 [Bemisia tabaci]XP_018898499.1 PREDICTED: uncharacterized protein LOC109031437 isoform X1 [Bemisia tabaci]XP_018898505.1 PREDICTED: uncharacterized protein LOC109031437 isoform X1 [Bemisia tabaci]